MGVLAIGYGVVTLSVFGLAGFTRLKRRQATPVLISAATLLAGWVWTVTTQHFVGFFEATMSYAVLDVISSGIIMVLICHQGISRWLALLWLTFICQLAVHLKFVPWLGIDPGSWAYFWFLNGFFICQLIIVTCMAVETLRGARVRVLKRGWSRENECPST